MHESSQEQPTPSAEAALAEAPGLRLRLRLFEGPLDLLLHLIRTNDMDVFDIQIAEVARQYHAYLELMRDLDLDVAGEYLVMAATLAHIKSRMLLPPEPTEDGAPPEDPRADLARQLLEYERLKQAAENLSALESVRSLVFTRPEGPLEAFRGEASLEVGLFDLLAAFRSLLAALDQAEQRHIRREQFSVAEKLDWLLQVLEQGPRWFVALIASFPSRGERIATFLAILELVRLGRITARQNRPRGDILIGRRDLDPVPGPGVASGVAP